MHTAQVATHKRHDNLLRISQFAPFVGARAERSCEVSITPQASRLFRVEIIDGGVLGLGQSKEEQEMLAIFFSHSILHRAVGLTADVGGR